MKSNKKNRGFSLVELIVVIAIMAVLVGVLAPAYLKYVQKSRLQKDISAIGEVIEVVKVSVADETIEKLIPESGATWETLVTMAGNGTGTITASSASKSYFVANENTLPNVSALATEVTSVVGTEVEFAHEVIKEKGIMLKVSKDDAGEVIVAVETYMYEDEEEVKKALEDAFACYRSNKSVIQGGIEELQRTIEQAYEDNYDYDAAYDAVISSFDGVTKSVYNTAYKAKYNDEYDSAYYASLKAAYPTVWQNAYDASRRLTNYGKTSDANSAVEKQASSAALAAADAAGIAAGEEAGKVAGDKAVEGLAALSGKSMENLATAKAESTAQAAALSSAISYVSSNKDLQNALAEEGKTVEDIVTEYFKNN